MCLHKVAVGFNDGTLQIYDTNLALTLTKRAHFNFISRIKYISSLSYAVTSSRSSVKVWDMANSWSLVAEFTGNMNYVFSLEQISATTMASGASGDISLWTITTGVSTLTINPPGTNFWYCLQLLPSGNLLAAGSSTSGKIFIYSTVTGTVNQINVFFCIKLRFLN